MDDVERVVVKRHRHIGLLLGILVGTHAPSALADVRLPRAFGPHMVLQCDERLPVWGTASPGESVRVSFRDATAETVADGDGRWMVTLPAQSASDRPATLSVRGTNAILLEDVAEPKEVRYAWLPFPAPPVNLYNRDGLPASPFRTQSTHSSPLK